MWESGQLPDQYLYQILHYLVVMNDLRGVILNAHLKYYKRNDKGEYELDHASDVPYTIYREEFEHSIAYLENKETDFYEKHVKVKNRPALVIKFEERRKNGNKNIRIRNNCRPRERSLSS